MFFSMSTTFSPLRRNSAAALTPLKPPATISTSHLMSCFSGGQYWCPLIIKVVIHQFWLTSLSFALKAPLASCLLIDDRHSAGRPCVACSLGTNRAPPGSSLDCTADDRSARQRPLAAVRDLAGTSPDEIENRCVLQRRGLSRARQTQAARCHFSLHRRGRRRRSHVPPQHRGVPCL